MWSLVGVNLAAAGQIGLLALCGAVPWQPAVFQNVHLRARLRPRAFILQRLKSWNLIDWGQRLELANGVLVALFLLQVAPGGGCGLWPGRWAVACLLWGASCGPGTTRFSGGVGAGWPGGAWERILAFVSM